MKKFSLLILFLFVLLPSMVSAHTHLAVSNPIEGQVVVNELKEITLTFDGNIEKLSSMKVIKDGAEMTALQVQIEAEKMFGILPEPLENGAYVIQWNIAGDDGHPITGEINFTVQKEEKGEGQSATIPDQGQDSSGSGEEDSVEVQITAYGNDGSEGIDKQNGTEEKSNSNTNSIITIIGFVIILGIGLLLLRKKKYP
ncbi:copper resistance CopC family protein [Neobacillus niacini]|uniref:copper resistance CopC family protein n=1 Tax=Neobacillus niacini TaxID=86668 RepID=UPI0006944BA0|nr:copper resistance protein CopC [Neobacillus niacini]